MTDLINVTLKGLRLIGVLIPSRKICGAGLGVFFISILSSSSLSAQQNKIDSLQNLLKTDNTDSLKVIHLNRLASAYTDMGQMKQAIDCGRRAVTLSQNIGFSAGEANAYSVMAGAYYLKADYKDALDYYNKALTIEMKNPGKSNAALILANIGLINEAQGNLPKATDYFFKSQKMAEEQKDKKMIALSTGYIGDVYFYQDEYPQALNYYNVSYKLSVETGNKKGEAYNLECLGNLYFKKKDYTTALDYYNKELLISQQLKDKRGMSSAIGNIGRIYDADSNYKEAINYFKSVLKQNEDMGNEAEVAQYVYHIGQVYLEQKKYKDAEQYILKSVKIADSISYHKGMNEANERLSDIYAKTGQWEKAYKSYKSYSLAKDTLFNRKKSEEIGKLEAKYEYDKQLAVQQADAENVKALAEAKGNRQEIITLLFGAIALSVALIALLILRSLKLARKEKLLAVRQKTEMELKALRAQMNPHFIFNAINSIQNFILNNDSKAAHTHLSKFSKLIRKVLENSRYETIPLAEEIRMLELYLELESLRFSSKFSYKISLDSSVDAEKSLIAPLIIQPFVENAIWHGLMHLKDKQGELSISFEQINNSLKCVINDNGIGRKRSFELKKDKTHESLGLNLAKDRLQIVSMLNKAKMNVKFTDKTSGDGSPAGTMVELLMPLLSNKTMYA